MNYWTVYLLTAAASAISGIPLRTSDLGQNGHLVHYHKDALSAGHRRHIHVRPPSKRSHTAHRETYFQNRGKPINPSAIYEVPSNRHYNGAHAARLALELQTLVERSFGENNNSDVKSDNGDSGDNGNGKNDNNQEHTVHSIQYRDAPTPPNSDGHAQAHFPEQSFHPGLQFLNTQTQEKRTSSHGGFVAEPTNAITLDLNTLLGDTLETSTLSSILPSYMTTATSLDLGFLLAGLSPTRSLDQSFGDEHHGHVHDQHIESQNHQDQHNQGHGHAHHIQPPDRGLDHHVQGHGRDHQVQGHGGQGGHIQQHRVNTNNANTVNTNIIQEKVPSRELGNRFLGTLKQHTTRQGHEHHEHQDVVTVTSVNTLPTLTSYQKSTLHPRPITKRGVSDNEVDSSHHKTFIDHILNIRIRSTTPPPAARRTTPDTLYHGQLTTPTSIAMQHERLSGINLHQSHQSKTTNHGISINNPRVNMNHSNHHKRTISKTKTVVPTSNEMVHLRGIHLMFANGKQEANDALPTIHLTASVSDNINHFVNMATHGSAPGSSHHTTPSSHNGNEVTNKITGTAVIRDGHLYLVVYPFGENKSLEIHYNQTTKRIALPRNKPVQFLESSKLQPAIQTTLMSSTDRSDSGSSVTSSGHTSEANAHHVSKPELSGHVDTMRHEGMGNGHMHNHGHASATPSLTGLRLSEFNDTMLQQLLAPIGRFMSPWQSLNFSKVFPYSTGVNKTKSSSTKATEEDSEVDVVTFVAKATDPFHRIKGILESLATTKLFNSPSVSDNRSKANQAHTEAKFNFEVEVKPSSSANTMNDINVFRSTANPVNSEEKTFDTNGNNTMSVTKSAEHVNVFKQVVGSSVEHLSQPVSALPGMLSGGYTEPIGETVNQEHDMITEKPKVTNQMSIHDSSVVYTSDKVVPTHIKSMAGRNSNLNRMLHVSGNIALSSTSSPRVSTYLNRSNTTYTYKPTYVFSYRNTSQSTTNVPPPVLTNISSTSHRKQQGGFMRDTGSKITPVPQRGFTNKHSAYHQKQGGLMHNTILGSKITPVPQRGFTNKHSASHQKHGGLMHNTILGSNITPVPQRAFTNTLSTPHRTQYGGVMHNTIVGSKITPVPQHGFTNKHSTSHQKQHGDLMRDTGSSKTTPVPQRGFTNKLYTPRRSNNRKQQGGLMRNTILGSNITPVLQRGFTNNLSTSYRTRHGGLMRDTGSKITPVPQHRFTNKHSTPHQKQQGGLMRNTIVGSKMTPVPQHRFTNKHSTSHQKQHGGLMRDTGSSKITPVPQRGFTNKLYTPRRSNTRKQQGGLMRNAILGSNINTVSQSAHTNRQATHRRKQHGGVIRNSMLGSNIQPLVPRTSPNRLRQGLQRGKSEQFLSLSDILNDIRRIQLHNRQRFNMYNDNNFDAMHLSETREKPVVRTPVLVDAPVFQTQTSKRRYSDIPMFQTNAQPPDHVTPMTTTRQAHINHEAAVNDAMEAMLVLSVNDIMSDQANLHGAIVLSHRLDSSSNKK